MSASDPGSCGDAALTLPALGTADAFPDCARLQALCLQICAQSLTSLILLTLTWELRMRVLPLLGLEREL